MTHWRLGWWLEFFSNKVFFKLTNVHFFWHNAIVQYSVNITFICTEIPKNLCDSFYFNICSIEVGWNWTCSISKVCLYIQSTWNHHHNHFLNIFITSKRNPIPFSSHPPIYQFPTPPTPPQLWEITNLLSVSMDLPMWTFHRNRIT